jgi:hypothetical protein
MVVSNTFSAMESSPKTRLVTNGSSVWHAMTGAMKSVLRLEIKLFETFACSEYKAKSDHSYENTATLNKNV